MTAAGVAASAEYQLETLILPALLKKVGDVKSGRLAPWMVEKYITDHRLVFNLDTLEAMFEEADFRREGSLTSKELIAVLSGRYPMRRYTTQWKDLVALLLGMDRLPIEDGKILSSSGTVLTPKAYVQSRMGQGTFNSDNTWRDDPAPLAKVRDQTRKSSPTGEWKFNTGTMSATGASRAPLSSATSTLKTTWGPRSLAPSAAEQALNHDLTQEGQTPRATLTAAGQFRSFRTQQEMAPPGHESSHLEYGAEAGMLLSDVAWNQRGAAPPEGSLSSSTFVRAPVKGVRAWSAALPPSAIHFNQSSLQTLRNSVRSTIASQPQFSTQHRMLSIHEYDMKKTLGKQIDMQDMSLRRVEPVRPTSVPLSANYIEAADYAPRCRTAPTRWFSEQTPKRDYPWSWPIQYASPSS